jgi:hypothetical protein
MNNISSQAGNISTRVDLFLVPIPIFNLITSIYSIPIGSLIGFMLNVVCLIVLCHRKLKGDTFKYLIFKTLIHLIFLFIMAISPIFRCASCPIILTLFANLVRYYFNLILGSMMSTVAFLIEIVLTYDRLHMLMQQKPKYLIKLSFWPTTISCVVIGVIANVPYILAFTYQQVPGTDIWQYVRTAVGSSIFYRISVIVLNLIQSLISLVVLIVLNILVKIKFSKYIKRKKSLTHQRTVVVQASRVKSIHNRMSTVADFSVANSASAATVATAAIAEQSNKNQQNESAELNFTWMIIVASLLFSVTRFIQFINVTVDMIYNQLGINSMLPSYLAFVSFFTTIVYYGSNLFTYIFFNRIFRQCFREIFRI